MSSWRRRRLKSVEFLGYDNRPIDPDPSKAFHPFASHRKHSAPDQNGVGQPEVIGVNYAERSGIAEPERSLVGDANRCGVSDAERGIVGELDEGIKRALGRESLWSNSAQEMRLRRARHQWERSHAGTKSLNLPDAGPPLQTGGEPVQPPLARFLRKKRTNFQSGGQGDDPWNSTRLMDEAKEWLSGQLDPWTLFQALQGLRRHGDGGILALELGRCTTKTDSCRCLLDHATSFSSAENEEGHKLPHFGLVREALSASKDDDLARIAEFLEVVDAIVDLGRSIGRSQSASATVEEERTIDDPEESVTSASGDRLNGPPSVNSLSEPTENIRQSNRDGYFRSEIVHPTRTTPCLYSVTCGSMDGGSLPVRRDQSFARRRHSALCHPDDEPSRRVWSPSLEPEVPSLQLELPSLSISIFAIDLSADCVRRLTRILVDYSLVTQLSIVRTGLGDGFGELCRAFDRCSQGIEHFDFRMNRLTDGDCVGHLSGALRSATALRSINLSSTGLGAEACRRLVDAIGTGSAANRVFAELDLGYNELHDEGCHAVATLIEMPGCWLRKLRLRHNGLGPVGAKRLAAALLTHPRLTLLDVSSNPIGDSGVSSLAESLLGNRTLRDIALDDCGISDKGCRGVARMLMTNSVLRSLTLSRNSLGDEGVRTLAEGVRYNRTLEVLGIDMCCLGNAGFICLLQELHLCHSMRVVRACYNTIGIQDHMSSGYRRWSSASVRIDAALGQTGSDLHLLDVYVQLCEVLRLNPKLKIFLWGNKFGEDEDDDDVTSAFRPEAGRLGAKWRRSRSAVDSGYGTLSSEMTSVAFVGGSSDKVVIG